LSANLIPPKYTKKTIYENIVPDFREVGADMMRA